MAFESFFIDVMTYAKEWCKNQIHLDHSYLESIDVYFYRQIDFGLPI